MSELGPKKPEENAPIARKSVLARREWSSLAHNLQRLSRLRNVSWSPGISKGSALQRESCLRERNLETTGIRLLDEPQEEILGYFRVMQASSAREDEEATRLRDDKFRRRREAG